MALQSSLAQGVVAYLNTSVDHPFATLVNVAQLGAADILDIDIEPELAQDRKVAIVQTERIRLVFSAQDLNGPRILSLREDFPTDQVHTNYDREADGLCLCVWEEKWDDLSPNLTPQALIERIRDWFKRTADGSLHQNDQPLEPLLPATPNMLVVPAGMPPGPYYVTGMQSQHSFLLDISPPKDNAPTIPFSIFEFQLPPQVHSAQRSHFHSLAEISAFVEAAGGDLIAALKAWLVQPPQLAGASQHLFILISIPKKAADDAPVEAWELSAFTTSHSIAALGVELGVTLTSDVGGAAKTTVALGGKFVEDIPDIRLDRWRVVERLDRIAARKFAATARTEDAQLVAIGAGAIGSNVVTFTSKAGIGTWTIIDDDVVLPHNTVRQTQNNSAVGYNKARVLATEVDGLHGERGAAGIDANFLRPKGDAPAIEQALADADIVIDFSASPAVLGELADLDARGRAASFFFNPDGTELVILAEDVARSVRIDEIEAQYFWAAANDPVLARHFDHARLDTIRYANACQDLTRPLPPWQVQVLSAIAGGQLINLLDSADSVASFWRLDPQSVAVAPHNITISGTQRVGDTGLQVSIIESAIADMRRLRAEAIPNETGGVLVGTFDLSRNMVHVLGVLAAPADSEQSPSFFVRGAKELKPLIDRLQLKSAGRLQYIGEWHSHPDKAAARPSADDEQVFKFLSDNLGPGGAPYIMVICGKKDSWLRAAWQNRGAIEQIIEHLDD